MSGTLRRQAGQLGQQVEGYRAWLEQHGYTAGTVVNKLSDVGQLGRWMSVGGVASGTARRGRVGGVLGRPASRRLQPARNARNDAAADLSA